jgi:hypothetical protein
VLLLPAPVVRLAGSFSPNGVIVSRLTVQAPQGTTVIVRCRGRGCPRTKTTRRGAGLERFKSFERSLRPGAVLEIWVVDRRKIGKYTRFVIRKGKAPARTDRCLNPRSTTPVACPR